MQTHRVRSVMRVIGVLAVVGIVAVGAVGCDDRDGATASGRSGSGNASAEVYRAGDSITVERGTTFVIALEANPTTGYSWSAEPNADADYVGSEQVPGRNLPGAPGTQRLSFRATSPGSSDLVLNYARPFEQGVAPVHTESFPLTVE